MNIQVNAMPMRETLEKLSKTAAVLNRESDALNAVIEDFEEQLEKAGVGISVWLGSNYALDQSLWKEKFDPETEHEWEEASAALLGYAKIESSWRVAVRRVKLRREKHGVDVEVFEGLEPMPLAKAPRIVRVEAASRLESLANVLILQMEQYVEGITEAKKLIKDT